MVRAGVLVAIESALAADSTGAVQSLVDALTERLFASLGSLDAGAAVTGAPEFCSLVRVSQALCVVAGWASPRAATLEQFRTVVVPMLENSIPPPARMYLQVLMCSIMARWRRELVDVWLPEYAAGDVPGAVVLTLCCALRRVLSTSVRSVGVVVSAITALLLLAEGARDAEERRALVRTFLPQVLSWGVYGHHGARAVASTLLDAVLRWSEHDAELVSAVGGSVMIESMKAMHDVRMRNSRVQRDLRPWIALLGLGFGHEYPRVSLDTVLSWPSADHVGCENVPSRLLRVVREAGYVVWRAASCLVDRLAFAEREATLSRQTTMPGGSPCRCLHLSACDCWTACRTWCTALSSSCGWTRTRPRAVRMRVRGWTRCVATSSAVRLTGRSSACWT